MMFGQPMEGNVLGVVLDVSGSMAEYLPAVVREVDKNFKDAPVVYVRNMLVRAGRESDNEEIRLIIPEEVKPYYELEIGGRTRSPFWFLWHDLPRKAPQRYVDRLIETYKTRPNQFISVGSDWGHRGRVVEAVSFLLDRRSTPSTSFPTLRISSTKKSLPIWVPDSVARRFAPTSSPPRRPPSFST